MASKLKTEVTGGATVILALIPFMLDQYGIHRHEFGWLALLGMVGTGLYTIWHLPYRKQMRGMLVVVFLIGSAVFGWWLHRHQTPQVNPLPAALPSTHIEQRTEGDNSPIVNSPNVAGNGNAFNYGTVIVLSPTEQIDTSQLLLFQRYGGEWQGTNDNDIYFTDDNAVLRKPFVPGKKYWFAPGVANQTVDLTVGVTTVFFNFPKEHGALGFSFPEEPDNPSNPWQFGNDFSTTYQYSVRIGGTEPGYSNSVSKVLWITFPKPGRYQVTYTIHGTTARGRGFAIPRRRFYFELT